MKDGSLFHRRAGSVFCLASFDIFPGFLRLVTPSFMELDLRKQRILQAVVEDYVATAEPVGSQVLVTRYTLGVKSATIRSEMAEMSEWGYLRQPHTSAGRVPSDRGYRFYVNQLMPLPVIQTGEAAHLREAIASTASELSSLLRQTCKLLAQMTRLPAVATPPDTGDTVLRQIFVSPVVGDKLLLVLLFSTGRAENRLLSLTSPACNLSASDALLVANALNERFAGVSVSTLRSAPADETRSAPPPELARFGEQWTRLTQEIAQTAQAVALDTPLVVEGSHAVLEQPEFRDVDRACAILSTLQERAALLEMLGGTTAKRAPGSTAASPTVRMAIGQENGRVDWADWTVVSCAYFVGDKEAGKIGVLGPTRMDYARASASVSFMARTMSDFLTRLSAAS